MYKKWTFADRLNLGSIWLKSFFAELFRWKKYHWKSNIRVYYGFDGIPSYKEEAFGGIVKIQDLQSVFPNKKKTPTILYLVTSALPYYSVQMARFAKYSGAKLVINQNGVAYPGWYGKGWEKLNQPMIKLTQMADYVVYQSRFCKLSAEEFLGKRKDLRYDILYNPVDTNVFCPLTKKEGREKVILLLSGSHWSFYRVQVALDILKKVRKRNKRTHLMIAGRFCWHEDEIAAKEEVVEYAKKLHIDPYINITGKYSQRKAPDLMRQGTILIHTKYNDPCPRLVVEAMASGLPVVYSATGGVPELVGRKAGIGIPGPLDWEKDHPPSSDKMADAILEILNNLTSFSTAARSRAVKKFDVKYWLECHRKFLNTL